MLYSVLKKRKHTLKVRKNDNISIVKQTKTSSNSFITKSKIKKFKKIKRFYSKKINSGSIININPHIGKSRHLLKK